MALEMPTVREPGHRHPIGVASVGSDEGFVSEDTLKGAGMIRERQAIEEIDVLTKDPAYRNGWEDGRFGPTRSFLENPNLAGWADHVERLAYYRGHRDGRRAREKMAKG
jgi:hypothetical protein